MKSLSPMVSQGTVNPYGPPVRPRMEFMSWFTTTWNASVSRIRYSPLTPFRRRQGQDAGGNERDNHRADNGEYGRPAPVHRQQARGIGPDAVKHGLGHGELPGVPHQQVQGCAERDVDKD